MSKCANCDVEHYGGGEDFIATCFSNLREQRDQREHERDEARKDSETSSGALELMIERYDDDMKGLVIAAGIPWEGKSHDENVVLMTGLKQRADLAERQRDVLIGGLKELLARQGFVALSDESYARTILALVGPPATDEQSSNETGVNAKRDWERARAAVTIIKKGCRTIRVIEVLAEKGWKPFDPSDIEKQPDGEFDLTLRIRTIRALRKPKKMR